ncbi:uncharacterized protein J3D65DRAFT_105464 [Phyllosticta citribraziliensis]|uniref:Uncharacterized protein n=1 Tax=Phyllosticta citribraziliensis TaxID=989973 RepID=A0ABR1LB04_9PEZI
MLFVVCWRWSGEERRGGTYCAGLLVCLHLYRYLFRFIIVGGVSTSHLAHLTYTPAHLHLLLLLLDTKPTKPTSTSAAAAAPLADIAHNRLHIQSLSSRQRATRRRGDACDALCFKRGAGSGWLVCAVESPRPEAAALRRTLQRCGSWPARLTGREAVSRVLRGCVWLEVACSTV